MNTPLSRHVSQHAQLRRVAAEFLLGKRVDLTLFAMKTPPHMHETPDENSDLVRNSVLYKEFLAEREEILRHKWIESEKLGHDIGFEKALLDWIVKYRSSWRTDRQAASHGHSSPG